MKEELEAVYDILSRLELKPTYDNVTILHGIYNSLRMIINELEGKENVRDSTTGS